MSYSEDYAYSEQCAQGEDLKNGEAESKFYIFVEENYGRPFHKLSNSECANAKWQFKHLKD